MSIVLLRDTDSTGDYESDASGFHLATIILSSLHLCIRMSDSQANVLRDSVTADGTYKDLAKFTGNSPRYHNAQSTLVHFSDSTIGWLEQIYSS